MESIDLIVLVLYLGAVLAMGLWLGRRSKTPQGFMAASGRLPGWAVGLSVFGTYLSSNTFLGVPGKAFSTNFNFFVFSLSIPFAAFFASKYFVPFYRAQTGISAYEHLEERFGTWARIYAMVCFLLTQLARTGTILFGVSLGLHALTGWDIRYLIIGMGILVTLYTLIGGIEAVIWTDVVQSSVLFLGALVIILYLISNMPQGFEQLVDISLSADKWSLGSTDWSFAEPTVWVIFFYGFFINLNNFAIDQSFVQRYHTTRTAKDARQSLWIGSLLYVPISLLFFFIGSSLFAFYQANPELSVGLMDATQSVQLDQVPGDRVLPHFIVNQLPPGLAGFILAALFAAAMSSIDTSLNASASVFHSDIYTRFFQKKPSDKSSMKILHSATLVFGMLGTGAALMMIGVQSILEVWWQLSGAFAAGVLGLFLLGFISKRPQQASVLTSLFIGLALIFWMSFSPFLPDTLQSPFHTHMTIVVGTLSILGLGLLLSSLKAKSN